MGIIDRIVCKLKRKHIEPPFFTKDFPEFGLYEIGDYTYGRPRVLHWGENVTLKIGKFCSIADNVKIYLGGNHRIDWISTYPFNVLEKYFPEASKILGHPATKGNVEIGNDVWIANDVTILSGVTISDGVVIGTGSVITKNIGPYEIWAGNPARFIKKRFNEEEIKKLVRIKWWNWEIDRITKSIPVICSLDVNLLLK